MGFLWVNWDSVNWAVVVPIAVSIAALAVAIWTKWSEARQRTQAQREAERARRSADLVATLGGSTWDGGQLEAFGTCSFCGTANPPGVRFCSQCGKVLAQADSSGTTTYTIRLHNAGQMSAAHVSAWAERSGRRVSDEVRFSDLPADGRDEQPLATPHVLDTPLDLCARWTDGNGTHTRALFVLDPFS